MSARLTLKGLVAAAARQCRGDAIIGTSTLGLSLVQEVLRLAELGLFGSGKRLARVERWTTIPIPLRVQLGVREDIPEEEMYTALEQVEEMLARLIRDPAWHEFGSTCEFAERVDSFLALLERGNEGGGVARSCREDLDLLLVLADWLEEQGRPEVASEARHLHSFTRSLAATLVLSSG